MANNGFFKYLKFLPKWQRNALWTVWVLGLLVIVISLVVNHSSEPKPLTEAERQQLATYADSIMADKPQYSYSNGTVKDSLIRMTAFCQLDTLSAFNPNEKRTPYFWRSVGCSPVIALRTVHYLEAGGRFNKKTDLLKIYDFPDTIYQKIEGKLLLPLKKGEGNSSPIIVQEKLMANDYPALNANSATAEDWKTIRGVGEVFSKRIVKYRYLLGGFHSINQLKEVYNLPDSTFQAIKSNVIIEDDDTLRCLSFNHLSESELAKHPYIKPAQARQLVALREKSGKINDVSILKSLQIFNEAEINRIKPYICDR